MQAILAGLLTVRRWAQALGPYLLVELVLPGGTVLALTLFLVRSGKLNPMALVAARAPKGEKTMWSIDNRRGDGS